MFDILALIVAMGGGVFGVAIGALPSFIFVGILVMIGVALMSATGGADASILVAIAFGAFGPHVGGFASGVAATAWGGNKKGLIEGGGRNILAGGMGMNSPTALIIGAVFGAVGYIINWALTLPGTWTDTIALTVVLSAIIVRFMFGSTGLFGKKPEGQSQLGHPGQAAWLPHQCDAPQLAVIGIGAALFSAYMASVAGPAGFAFGFGLSAFSLIFLQFGVPVPVTHHITLVAAQAYVASGSYTWAVIFGLLAVFIGEYASRLFLVYGDSHIDPPAVAIFLLTSIVFLFSSLGIFAVALP